MGLQGTARAELLSQKGTVSPELLNTRYATLNSSVKAQGGLKLRSPGAVKGNGQAASCPFI